MKEKLQEEFAPKECNIITEWYKLLYFITVRSGRCECL